MKLADKDILHLARLANLTLTQKEVEVLKTQLTDVINYFEELKKLRTDNIKPTSQTTGLEGVLRADKVDSTRVLALEEALSTDRIHNGAFVVPQVISKEQ